MAGEESAGVWNAHSTRWQLVGPPLRPSPQDGRMMLQLAEPYLTRVTGAAPLVVLGVTPEIVHLDWPANVSLLACDQSAEMIAKVWSPHASLPSAVQQIRWQNMPRPDRSVACFVGDGSLNVFPYLNDYRDVFGEVRQLLTPEGALILRIFVRPDVRAALQDVERAVTEGEIKSFHALKWHVAMTITEAPEYSVKVTDIRDAIMRMFPDRARLAEMRSWPRAIIDGIDSYADVDTRYSFPTLDAIKDVCASYFEIADKLVGEYEIAERCPTILFRPLGA